MKATKAEPSKMSDTYPLVQPQELQSRESYPLSFDLTLFSAQSYWLTYLNKKSSQNTPLPVVV